MKKTGVYIDGYNLYYGMLKGTPYKWLELEKLIRSMIKADHDLVFIKYFTAPIKTYPYDAAALERQNLYLQAIATNPKIQTILGYYAKHTGWLPAHADECKQCSITRYGMVPVMRLEEKRSDVNIAVSMLVDATRSDIESFILVTGDSDQVGSIEALRYVYRKSVIVLNPQSGLSEHLKRAASYYQNIPRDLPAHCQLPDELPIGTHGRMIHRPPTW